jgi:hypothetical protein
LPPCGAPGVEAANPPQLSATPGVSAFSRRAANAWIESTTPRRTAGTVSTVSARSLRTVRADQAGAKQRPERLMESRAAKRRRSHDAARDALRHLSRSPDQRPPPIAHGESVDRARAASSECER